MNSKREKNTIEAKALKKIVGGNIGFKSKLLADDDVAAPVAATDSTPAPTENPALKAAEDYLAADQQKLQKDQDSALKSKGDYDVMQQKISHGEDVSDYTQGMTTMYYNQGQTAVANDQDQVVKDQAAIDALKK